MLGGTFHGAISRAGELSFVSHILGYHLSYSLPHRQCSPYRLATYLERVYNEMRDDEHLELQRASIFSSESGEFYCIADLYTPEQYHIELGLPIVRWRDSAGSKHPSEG